MTDQPWRHRAPEQSQLSLVAIPEPVLHAMARGEAGAGSTPYLVSDECTGLWRYRSRQITETPTDAAWVTRFVMVPGVDAAVGVAGFHGAPDDVGMVEVGYRIDPEHRRKGYARQSLETLLAVADAHPAVHVVRASISPDNVASRSLVDGYGFEVVGEQWDDEDGLEIVLERAAARPVLRHRAEMS